MSDPTNSEQQELRAAAFRDECDPLFFKWHRGENNAAGTPYGEDQYRAAVDAVRARYPYPTNPELKPRNVVAKQ